MRVKLSLMLARIFRSDQQRRDTNRKTKPSFHPDKPLSHGRYYIMLTEPLKQVKGKEGKVHFEWAICLRCVPGFVKNEAQCSVTFYPETSTIRHKLVQQNISTPWREYYKLDKLCKKFSITVSYLDCQKWLIFHLKIIAFSSVHLSCCFWPLFMTEYWNILLIAFAYACNEKSTFHFKL